MEFVVVHQTKSHQYSKWNGKLSIWSCHCWSVKALFTGHNLARWHTNRTGKICLISRNLPALFLKMSSARIFVSSTFQIVITLDHYLHRLPGNISSASAVRHAVPAWVTCSVSQWASHQTQQSSQTGTTYRSKRGTKDGTRRHHSSISSSVMLQHSKRPTLIRASVRLGSNTQAPSSLSQNGFLHCTNLGCTLRHPAGPNLMSCLHSGSIKAGLTPTPWPLEGTCLTLFSTTATFLAHSTWVTHIFPPDSAPSPQSMRVSKGRVEDVAGSSSRH